MILGKGDFGPEKYNESYLSFIENQHRKQGLDVIKFLRTRNFQVIRYVTQVWCLVVLTIILE